MKPVSKWVWTKPDPQVWAQISSTVWAQARSSTSPTQPQPSQWVDSAHSVRADSVSQLSPEAMYNSVPESVSSPFGVRFEFLLKHWIHSWLSEIMEEFHSVWATEPASTGLWLEPLLGIGGFSSTFGCFLTSSLIIVISLHTYCDICGDC